MTDALLFRPTWMSAPGDTIAELLDEREWSQADLALRTGFTKKHVNELVRGRASITANAAERLSAVLGSTAEFWITREAKYQAAQERLRTLESRKTDTGWLSELPVQWMIKQGLILPDTNRAARVDACLRYFGVANVDAWRETYTAPLAAFRSSAGLSRRLGTLATWLRVVELEAARVECLPFELATFREVLSSARGLTAQRDPQRFLHELRELCAAAGVAVVWSPAPPGCAVHGVTRWLSSTKALLALSARYRTDDQLWFSFFHEAGHIVKHGKKLLFIEGVDGLDADKEAEADRYAASTLIPSEHNTELAALRTELAIKRFAASLSLTPGIVVGRLQHDGMLSHAQMNHLKVRYEWATP